MIAARTNPPAGSSSSAPSGALTLATVALMLVLGVALELVRFGDLQWLTKLPLAVLLLVALRRRG